MPTIEHEEREAIRFKNGGYGAKSANHLTAVPHLTQIKGTSKALLQAERLTAFQPVEKGRSHEHVTIIVGAIRLRKEIDNEWLLILGGIVSVLFGVVMMAAPGAGALALITVIGIYAMIIGALLVALSFRLKKTLVKA
ncbi:MAG TPA: DUF308 domain-containing protein [Bradyrhizobium sp.]|nr:DUF308 domain-containing protein [Bradyrhizobium sp.]